MFMAKKIRKILIANRGEIAVRIIQTCKKLGIQSAAVYSDADRKSRHVLEADQAFHLGASPSSESYLRGEKIIEIALKNGVQAIHPGYGFLSENADFAKRVNQSGLLFIGPSPKSIQLMGSKLASKEAVANFGVPLVPGVKKAVSDVAEAKNIANEIGFPILIKASAGGGGKGMRVVENMQELPEQMKRAINEAESSFGDGSVFIEKYLSKPRHIEIQILGDQFGNIVHLFERECSIQRRHQKLVEEAPSAVLTDELRKEMGDAAIKVAKAAEYYNAGTVEFLLDEKYNFYFLEMNTRLQVEHPVTEMITGLDLVEEQIKIAEGKELTFKQDDLKIEGHAIEFRVCAENPEDNFSPDIGQITKYIKPSGSKIRVDDFIYTGAEIPIFYDNMFAKLIVHAQSRPEAIELMKKAIEGYRIEGVYTTLSFGDFVMNHPKFQTGDFDTGFVEKYFKNKENSEALDKYQEVARSFAQFFFENHQAPFAKMKKNEQWQNRSSPK